MEDIVEGLVELNVPSGRESRRELAEAWMGAADLARNSEGDCRLFYESIQTAASLDPDNREIAYEAEFQRERQNLFEQRIAAAEAERKRRSSSQ